MPPSNDWGEWSNYVLKELERLGDCYEKLDSKIDKLDHRLTGMQIKMAGIGGTVAILVTVILKLGFNI